MGRGVASSRSPSSFPPGIAFLPIAQRPPVLMLFPSLPRPTLALPVPTRGGYAADTPRLRSRQCGGIVAAPLRGVVAEPRRGRSRSRGMHVPIGADRLHRHFELIKADHSRVEPPRLLSATFCKNGPRLRGGNGWLRPAPL